MDRARHVTDRPWLKFYPAGVPTDVAPAIYPSLVALVDESLQRHRARPACRFMGRMLSFAQLDEMSRALAAWLQTQALSRGDRVAIMLPNVPQYPVAVAAVLRAGMVVVNVNPALTPRELEHQLRDAGARAIVVLESHAAALVQVLASVPTQTVVVASMGDLLGRVKGAVVNHIARRVHKAPAAPDVPGAVRFNDALRAGRLRAFVPPAVGPDDIALLQYTGGTGGAARAAVLLHRSLVATVLQCEAWLQPALARMPAGEPVGMVCALPLHHGCAFTLNLLLGLRLGACNLLVPDPRDIGGLLRDLAGQRFHVLPAVDSLLLAIARHPDCTKVDWTGLRVCLGGGMPLRSSTARLWLEKTGCAVAEGYGLTEAGPLVTCNPLDGSPPSGTVGLPLPATEVAVLDDAGQPLPAGSAGEVAVRGPQVMAGYWQRPDETARVMTADGWLRSGDVGAMDERGQLRLVDRKKDTILVSGFSVYPNEVEQVIAQMPGVLECAAVAMADDRAGEVVRVVIVRRDPRLTEADIRAHCEANLTGYKRPRRVEFRDALPKSPVGKVLRRELRDAA